MACDRDEATPTPTATPTAIATLPAPPASTGTPEATPTATRPAPEGDRTGIAEVDAVIAAVEGDDPQALAALMQTVEAPCTNAQGAGGPPKCWTGTTVDQARPEGTVLEVFPYATCELEWRIDLDPVAEETLTVAGTLFAVLRLDRPLFTGGEDYLPGAEYAVVFTGTNAGAESVVVVALEDDRVTFVDRACGAGTSARAYLDERPVYGSAEVILRGPAFED